MRALGRSFTTMGRLVWAWVEYYIPELWMVVNFVLLGFLVLLASSIFLSALLPEFAVDIDTISESKVLPAVPVVVGALNLITSVLLFRRIFLVRPKFMFMWVSYYAIQALFILLIGFGMWLCVVVYLPQHISKLEGPISVAMLTYFGLVKSCLGILCVLYAKWRKEANPVLQSTASEPWPTKQATYLAEEMQRSTYITHFA